MGNAIYRAEIKTYQNWAGYPDTPVPYDTESHKYQFIGLVWSDIYLLVSFSSDTPAFNRRGTSGIIIEGPMEVFKLVAGTWEHQGSSGAISLNNIYEANNPIYTDITYTTIYFDRTIGQTGSSPIANRVRNLRHKNTSFVRIKSTFYKTSEKWNRVNL